MLVRAMNEHTDAVGTWWSYADGNSTLVGIVVAVLAVAALVFVGSRVVTRGRRR